VPSDHGVGHWKESPVETLRSLDTRFLADATHPFVRACERVARLTCLATLKSARVHVLPPPKERSEECDLGFR
jgi:precorrin-6x reductase